jgi:hypothetical protein
VSSLPGQRLHGYEAARLSVQDDVYWRGRFTSSQAEQADRMKSTNGERAAVNDCPWPGLFVATRVRPRFPSRTAHSSRAEARRASETVRPNKQRRSRFEARSWASGSPLGLGGRSDG